MYNSTILAWKAFAHEENSQLVEAEQESYKVCVTLNKRYILITFM